MSFQITLSPSQRCFTAHATDTLLEAALRAGIVFPYGCKDGACGTCLSQVMQGQWEQGANTALSKNTATPNASNLQAILPCCAKPRSDMTLLVREVSGLDDIPIRKLPVRIKAIERPEATIALLRLQLPASEKFVFKAGQYIDLILQNGQRRSFSLANAPHENGELVLHIRYNPNGLVSKLLFPDLPGAEPALKPLQERDILRFEGPLGTFFLREDSNKPLIMLASGTGFAPIRSLIEDLRQRALTRPIHLYWGGRRPAELYHLAQCEEWVQALPDFRFIPVVSEPQAEDDWQGRVGLVHQAVMQDLPEMQAFEVYACGAPPMIQAARRDFVTLCHLPSEAFYADSFEPASAATPTIS